MPTFFWKPCLGNIHKFTVTLPPFLAPVLFPCFLSQEELTGFGGSSLSKRIQKLLTFANFLNIYDHVNTSWGPCKGPIKPKALKLTPSSFKLPSLLLSSFLSYFFFSLLPFFKSFFLMRIIFKVFIEFVTIMLLLYVLGFWPWSMWDLSSQPGIEHAPLALEGKVLTTGLPRKSQVYSLLLSFFLNSGSLDFNTSLYCFYGNPLQYSCLENPMDGGAW